MREVFSFLLPYYIINKTVRTGIVLGRYNINLPLSIAQYVLNSYCTVLCIIVVVVVVAFEVEQRNDNDNTTKRCKKKKKKC